MLIIQSNLLFFNCSFTRFNTSSHQQIVHVLSRTFAQNSYHAVDCKNHPLVAVPSLKVSQNEVLLSILIHLGKRCERHTSLHERTPSDRWSYPTKGGDYRAHGIKCFLRLYIQIEEIHSVGYFVLPKCIEFLTSPSNYYIRF